MRLTPELREAVVPLVAGGSGHEDRIALTTADAGLSYGQLAGLVEGARRWLGAERRLVLLRAGNDVDSVVWYLAALAGRHPVLLCEDRDEAAAGLVERYDPDVVVRAGDPDERHRTTVHALHEDLALLLSTSGSTGSPRLVRLSRANLEANAASIAGYLALGPADRAVTSLPLHYCYGLSVLNSHLAAGASVTLTDHSVVDPCFWELFRSSSVTGLPGVPHTFALLDRTGFGSMDLPSLRYVTQAGGRLAPEVVRRYAQLGARRGWDLYVMYGQTEATARMGYLPPDLAAAHPAAVGVAVPGGSFGIDPVAECELPGHGEVVYRGPNVMLGYAEGPADLAAGRTVDELRTGDLGYVDEGGLLHITGRRSRFAKLFGLRIDLGAIEAHLARRGVDALCASDDARLCVAVAGGDDAAGDAMRAHVLDVVALPPTAVHVVVVEELPRLANGKPDHAAVAALLAAPAPAAPDGATGDVRSLFARALGIDAEAVRDHDTFVDLGGDSLSYVELSLALEDELGALPAGWHLLPVSALAERRARRRRGWVRRIDTSVALRAVAIVLIVGNHVGSFRVPGGAHVLLAVAGYNLARFGLQAPSLWPSIGRIVLPAVAWIGLLAATTDEYGVANALLVNTFVGPRGSPWSYWFLEVLVLFLVGVAATRSVPAVRRLERAHPFGVAAAVLGVGLAIRFDVLDVPTGHYRLYRPQEVLWLFALGWAAARANARQRVALAALGVAGAWGFASSPTANVVVGVGLLALLLCRTVPVPRAAALLATTLAASSLAIYLVHFQVYPRLTDQPDVVAVAASLAAGILAGRLAAALHLRLRAWAERPGGRRGLRSPELQQGVRRWTATTSSASSSSEPTPGAATTSTG